MKFILFNVSNSIKNCKIERYEFDNDCYINEVNIPYSKLEKRLNKQDGFVKKIKENIFDKCLKKCILKALDKSDSKWYYSQSSSIKSNANYLKYIELICSNMLGYKYVTNSEMITNSFEYIKNHFLKNELNIKNGKVLLVYKKENINFTLLNNLISNIKTVNIYMKNPSSYIQNQINKINQQVGSTIEIIKGSKKAFTDYDVIYFVDCLRCDFSRFRFNKKALILDYSIEDEDIYNTNIVFLNNYINDVKNKEIIQKLIESYGKLVIATYIKKVKSSY